VLFGRGAELERIDTLLEGAQSGRGGGLIVRGDPGIGKTALLEEARERAGHMAVATASGVESEARLPFAALGELASPMLDRVAELPEPQAAAISAALALAPAEGIVNERLATFAGFLGLIRATARDRPLLLLVDDAHWLDRPSSECLGYAARRLGDVSAALLVAARTGVEIEPLGGSAEELPLAGLARREALALLSDADLAPAVAERLVDLSLGNPLALRELPSMLSEEQRRGVTPIDPVPAPNGALAEAFGRRVTAAGPNAAALLLVASAALDRTLAPVIAAARDLGIPDRALEQCESAGLLETDGEGFRFAHPLVRGIVYAAAPAPERRRAHGALAVHTSPDSRAWHLAEAAIGPDDEVAAELDRAARRAGERGAHTAAADALERAAALSSESADRFGRLHAAGLAAAMSGGYERGAALLESAAGTEDPGRRATARHLLAMVTLNGGIRNGLENHTMLTQEAERIAPRDPAMAALMHADAGVTATVVGTCDMVLASAERAVACLPADAPDSIRAQALSIHGMGLALKGRTAEAAEASDRAGALLPRVEPVSAAAQSIAFGLMARLCTGREATLREETRGLARVARENRSLGILPWFQLQTADAGYRLGDWAEAERDIDDAIANAEVSGQLGPLSIALIIRARIHAARGREQAAREDARRGVEIAEPVGYASPRAWSLGCLGFLELGLGRVDEAIEELELAEAVVTMAGLKDPVLIPWAPDLIEAYVRAGRPADAERVSALLSEQAARSDTPLALALAARCRGLISDAAFEDEFERALELHESAGQPLEQGRTLLAYGSRLHRARRRVAARDQLRNALEVFEELGSPPWRERVRAELRATGAIERPAVYGADELTAQELRVALAVARGAKNREVAAELFLSPKTIEFHLGRVYRKLDIHSRTELAALVGSGKLAEVGLGAAATGDDASGCVTAGGGIDPPCARPR
jgi:DNA-binding NarL/FixJ family response regulator